MNLNDPVTVVPYVGGEYAKKLEKLQIKTIFDLLMHIPSRYLDYSQISDISLLRVDEEVTVEGIIIEIKNQYTRGGRKIQIGKLSGNDGFVNLVWFNQPFLVRAIPLGTKLSVAGKVSWWNREKAIISPSFEKIVDDARRVHTGKFVPVYPETSGVSSKWLRSRIDFVLEKIEIESLDGYIKELYPAIYTIHKPKDESEYIEAKRRLAYDEILLFAIGNLNKKYAWQRQHRAPIIKKDNDVAGFIKGLRFKLTGDQEKAISEVLKDLRGETPMNRLLEGDVGSGKTIVATIAILNTFLAGYQSLIMAPTQILAEQHFKTLSRFLKKYKMRVKLVTGSTDKNLDEADLLVGTHALLHRNEKLDNVGLVVVDEQHKFGVAQRALINELASSRGQVPHVLTMTATPIPRTAALVIYGDLDISIISEMPKGRTEVTTWVIPPEKRDSGYEWISEQITQEKSQVFVVCPLIEESENAEMEEVKSVKKEFEKLKKVFKDKKLGLLHGRLVNDEKNEVIEKFRRRETDILVTTPVIEVGIDIPNATIMLIESADRFGLAQLHQLRGRVGRGSKKSYCLLFSEMATDKSTTRLAAMTKYKSGFDLAKIDLKTRGPGEIFGKRQAGVPEFKLVDWSDVALINAAKEMAEKVVKEPENFKEIMDYYKSRQMVEN